MVPAVQDPGATVVNKVHEKPWVGGRGFFKSGDGIVEM
jgi:hypothetical protein